MSEKARSGAKLLSIECRKNMHFPYKRVFWKFPKNSNFLAQDDPRELNISKDAGEIICKWLGERISDFLTFLEFHWQFCLSKSKSIFLYFWLFLHIKSPPWDFAWPICDNLGFSDDPNLHENQRFCAKLTNFWCCKKISRAQGSWLTTKMAMDLHFNNIYTFFLVFLSFSR